MPKGPKSVGQLCAELGMDAISETNFRKESQSYLKDHVVDVPNAPDDVLEKLAFKFLNAGAGAKHFSWNAALNYQWEAGEHRLTIVTYVGDIMKQQRWYMIDRLHKRVKGAVHYPGCLLHKARLDVPTNGRPSIDHDGQLEDASIVSEASEVESIHHVASNNDHVDSTNGSVQGNESRKRTRASLGFETVSPGKRRKSNESENGASTIEVAKGRSQSRVSTHSNLVAPGVRASGFTPVNAGVVVEVPRPPQPATAPAPIPTSSIDTFNTSMRYRGKMWHFDSVAHKAKVLELVLKQEEKDVDAYPIRAFSKGAKKAAFRGEEDSDGEESVLKDYFRLYTNFMNERFPSNEKILLENGVKPSA